MYVCSCIDTAAERTGVRQYTMPAVPGMYGMKPLSIQMKWDGLFSSLDWLLETFS